MDIRCPSCSKLFRVADEKIAGKGIRFKCSKCAEIVTITKDDFEMDLLAREAEPAAPAPQQPREPASKHQPSATAAPSAKPTPQKSIPTHEPEAREYQPPQEQEQDLPPAALSDFDFSEPHAAAMAAAHPEEGFGGQDFSFTGESDQDAAPEVEISLEAAAEAEAALQFPDDLISEPTRKPVFGTSTASEPAADDEPVPAPKPEAKNKPLVTPPSPKPAPEMRADEELDLGAALAMPKGPSAGMDLTEEDKDAVFASPPPVQKGPVITPELLAQMQRKALKSPAAKAKEASHDDEDLDLGAALAMPRTGDTSGKEKTDAGTKTATAARDAGSTLSGKAPLIIVAVALVLVAALAGLYFMGYMDFLLGRKGQTKQQQPASQPKAQTSRPAITPEGLSIVDPVAFVDPERGDLVITGKIQNTTDKPKHDWYLVAEVRDAKETVLTTVRMLNGTQLYSKADKDILVKRGGKLEELQKKMASIGDGAISPKGSMPFEIRVMNPPAGSARFLPALRSLDPAAQEEMKQEITGHK